MTPPAPDSGSLAARLATELSGDPARPRLTWHAPGEAAGARVELSGASMGNAAAKTAGLLREEFVLDPGARVELQLAAPHWQLAVWLLGTWSAGATAVLRSPEDPPHDEPPPSVVVLGPDHLPERAAAALDRGAEEVVALTLDAFGGPFREPLPPYVVDHAVAARAQPDQFRAVHLTGREPLLVDGDGRTWTGDDLAALAASTAPPDGWVEGDRVLHTGPIRTGGDVVAALVAPWLVGASVIWWWNPPAASFVASMTAEQVSVVTRATDTLPTAVRVLTGAPVSS